MNATLTIYRTKSLRRSQRWAWRLVAANGRIIAASGEGYSNLGEALRMARKVTHGGFAGAPLEVPA